MLYLIFSRNREEHRQGGKIVSSARKNLAVLASGTGSNFRAIAAACRQDDYPARVACLITDNPEAGAIDIAVTFGIAHFTVTPGVKRGHLPDASEREIVSICRREGVDLIALAGFMRIIKTPLLEAYNGRILNIHPSLLPSFKGLHAQRQAFDYGVKIAGCSVHFVDQSVDGGPIIVQAAVQVRGDDDPDSLAARILEQEHIIYPEAIRLVAAGRVRIEGRRTVILDSPGSG
jgi:phosphoribosylglycinamide formyltransferase-1